MRIAKKVAAVGLVTGAMMTFGAGAALAKGGDEITNTNTSVGQSCVANQGLGAGVALGILGQAEANPSAGCSNANG
ncbi:hypothetical protein HDA32_005684 [Spinactinospora alkalitolerans]|uniref:Chaplin domain-containing protein n=1 Tax=Spinactinospora alkalitolerans TaxID=687207 RepID=A0A852U8Y2_9ACTN|nr:hypothetical protein [Spinactinospora alkalitolerans]NYE50564.1 hypothetical protein [Spinactinospora alkalitolerans]